MCDYCFSMTGVGGRPEIIIIGSHSMEGSWEVRYRPGDIIAFGEIHSLIKQPAFRNATTVSPNPKVWEKRTKTPYWWRATTQVWVVFLTNQKNYLNLGNDASSVWNFCARFSDVISRGNQWWCREMSAVLSGYVIHHTIKSPPYSTESDRKRNVVNEKTRWVTTKLKGLCHVTCNLF